MSIGGKGCWGGGGVSQLCPKLPKSKFPMSDCGGGVDCVRHLVRPFGELKKV